MEASETLLKIMSAISNGKGKGTQILRFVQKKKEIYAKKLPSI